MRKAWNFIKRKLTAPGSSTITEATISDSSGPNTTLANYLRYYLTLSAPGYAVLVTGPWGVGKTHQVKQVIPESQRYYVSLYGLESVNSIHDAVLASCLPSMKIGNHLSTIGDVGKSMGDKFALAGLASGVWSVYLRHRLKTDRTIVFDDLERSSLWRTNKSELLGAINQYAEHLGFRVVVICHEERIAEELSELKEKTFGHTVKATPQTAEAIDAFLVDIKSETTKAFISDNLPLIKEIWIQSQQSSLRILKHVLSDVARLSEVFTAKHIEKKEAIHHILRFFCALDIEVRAGNLNQTHLVDRVKRYVQESTRDDLKNSQSFNSANHRYPDSDLAGKILSDEIIVATLIDGYFDSQSIVSWIDQTSYFIKPADADPWRIVINFDEVDDVLLAEGIALMQKQFDERAVTNTGELRHIMALRLMMTENNESGLTLEDERNLCIRYIDDLTEKGKVPEYSLVTHPYEHMRGYDGFGYWVTDGTRPHFDAICEHLDRAQQQAFNAKFPEYAAEILNMVREDQASLFSLISTTNSGQGIYANIPVLAHIAPKDFLDAWLSGPRVGWRKVTVAIDNRYFHDQLERKLPEEKQWLIELKVEFDKRLNKVSGLAALRLIRIRPEVFDRVRAEDFTAE